MKEGPGKITLAEWDARYRDLRGAGLEEPAYGGPLSRHVDDGDYRLECLEFDDSPAALRLWNFLLTEEERLLEARGRGKKIVGAMKDLGTIPVMAYSSPELVAFYPDGAWWIPCVMEMSAGLLAEADSLGIDGSFCPVRAMLGAFTTKAHFPIPDLLISSAGATCDDFSAVAQRLTDLGHSILWWEIPHRRPPDPEEETVNLPGGFQAPRVLVDCVKEEFRRILRSLEDLAGHALSDDALRQGIRSANSVRRILSELRHLAYTAEACPMPALEMQIAEMLAIHFCSDREESIKVLKGLLDEVESRVRAGRGVLPKEAARVFWVNPVADLRAMNLLEDAGGRICGTEYLFCHALDEIPEDPDPVEALARTALADPMVGDAEDRADRIARDVRSFGAEACLVSRIPGASHCALEGDAIKKRVQEELGIPVVEVEVPPVSDPLSANLRTRMEAIVEMVKESRMP